MKIALWAGTKDFIQIIKILIIEIIQNTWADALSKSI